MNDIALAMKCTCTQVKMDIKDKKVNSIVTMDKPLMAGSTKLETLSFPFKLEIGKNYNFVLTDVKEPVEPEGRLIREEDE